MIGIGSYCNFKRCLIAHADPTFGDLDYGDDSDENDEYPSP